MVFVIAKDGSRLMPTHEAKARKLLKSGRAEIYQHSPFTIKLLYDSKTNTQPIELKIDTGYQHIGISICSEKHEYISEERYLLYGETEQHDTRRKLRRTRRGRKTRYRKPRFKNRKASKPKGWLPPSLKNKKDQHILLFERYYKVCPITSVTVEVGQFDTQVLKAISLGKSLPQGIDYQHGEQYAYDTLREAVFARDNYTCIVCQKSAIKDNKIIRVHHLGFWHKDRTNRLGNLATVCTGCHTQKNHKPNGKLWGLPSSTKTLKEAAFMNAVKNRIVSEIKAKHPDLEVFVTFGSITKRTRIKLNIEKSHANDAYCIGKFHPKHRAKTLCYKKKRKNNRILEKFYDAKYIDIRDNLKKSAGDLSCGRTNRKESRRSEKNERIYRGEKVSKGRRTLCNKRYAIQSGDIVLYKGKKYTSAGIHCNGTRILLLVVVDSKPTKKSIKLSDVRVVKHINGWVQL